MGIRLTLEVHNIRMLEIIKYITNLANLKYRIVPGKVEVVGEDKRDTPPASSVQLIPGLDIAPK